MASMFSDLSHEAVTAVLPALLASMGVAAAALGTIEGVADGLSSAAKLYGGWWADRLRHRKPLCAVGYGAMAFATAIIASAIVWPAVLVGRGLAWVARGLRTPARKALLAEAVTPQTYGRAFGFERTMDTLGAFFESMEGFQVIITFMIFPLFFLSAALYPVENLDPVMGAAVRANPVAYAVDALRWALIGKGSFDLWLDLAVLLLFDAAMVLLGTWAFRKMKL